MTRIHALARIGSNPQLVYLLGTYLRCTSWPGDQHNTHSMLDEKRSPGAASLDDAPEPLFHRNIAWENRRGHGRKRGGYVRLHDD
jgi:hypothetical protein